MHGEAGMVMVLAGLRVWLTMLITIGTLTSPTPSHSLTHSLTLRKLAMCLPAVPDMGLWLRSR